MINKQNQSTASKAVRPRAIYYAITLALPLVFLALLEGGIRLLGVVQQEPLFVDGPPGYLRPNEAVVNRFFMHESRAPQVSIDTTFFRREKSVDTFRVVVQGGSSAAGFPYGKWASLSGMLGQRLRRIAPERQIEVVSTAMSAVNSYALLDFAEEIISIQPDAVLIYAGHNEYLGILGVGSAFGAGFSPARTRMLLALRQSHLFRAMQHLYGAVTAPSADSAARRSGTLMARIASDRAIPFGSDVYRAGLEQFSHNLRALLAAYEKAGVPVFIGTLVSNESGQAPFISAPGDATSLAALRALEPGATDSANRADHFFDLGSKLRSAGDPIDARRAYGWARDLDALRFRAPAAMSAVIAAAAAAHAATIVDVDSALARSSPDGIIGDELMLEHLHPNLRGYFLLADAYFTALTAAIEPQSWPAGPDREVAWQEIPVTEIEGLAAGYRLRYLKSDWPFQERKLAVEIEAPRNETERIAQDWFFGRISWLQAMQRALVHYQRSDRLDEATKIALNLATAFPFESNPQYVSGRLLLATEQPRRALAYLRRATRMSPDNIDAWLALNGAYAATGQQQEARDALGKLLQYDPDNAEALRRLE
ncbi:MAG: tetratricopeptide repeat protein [Gammaproteobacteria bacterium]|nr:tetratricopeptide repeat protein [Gammaproteobacteria bacterium]